MIFPRTEEEVQKAIRENPLVVIQLGSETCAPCAAIRQKTDSCCRRNSLPFYYLDAETFSAFAAAESLFSVPAVLVYTEGQLSLRECGYFSLEEIFRKVDRLQKIISAK